MFVPVLCTCLTRVHFNWIFLYQTTNVCHHILTFSRHTYPFAFCHGHFFPLLSSFLLLLNLHPLHKDCVFSLTFHIRKTDPEEYQNLDPCFLFLFFFFSSLSSLSSSSSLLYLKYFILLAVLSSSSSLL